MAGTDPEEGAALAKAVLRRLVAHGATVFVTSHLGALKLFAHAEPGLANASMLFDPQRRVPLFRMQTGIPGSSNALATAERLGFDARLLDQARRERGEAAGRIESVLRALEEERRRLEQARQEAEIADAEARRVREEAATQLEELTRRRRELVDAARREASDLVSRVQARIERTIRELREAEASRDAIRATRHEVEQIREELHSADAADSDASSPSAGAVDESGAEMVPQRSPQPGDIVWIRRLQREGRLENVLDDGRASVRYGNAEVMVHLRELEFRKPAPSSSPRPARSRGGATGGFEVDSSELETLELHVRGLDREEAVAEVERFLDRALLHGAPMARIVHGKGEGVLRRAVHDLLHRHPRVSAFRLGEHGEGGYGVTIVTLQ
jgi:DNA mismatch repair protein MutS2